MFVKKKKKSWLSTSGSKVDYMPQCTSIVLKWRQLRAITKMPWSNHKKAHPRFYFLGRSRKFGMFSITLSNSKRSTTDMYKAAINCRVMGAAWSMTQTSHHPAPSLINPIYTSHSFGKSDIIIKAHSYTGHSLLLARVRQNIQKAC